MLKASFNPALYFMLCAVLCSSLSFASQTEIKEQELPIFRGVGGNFTLDSTLQHKLSLSDFNDKLIFVTFGYTNCTDVCQITLSYLNRAMKALAEDAAKTKVMFISLDTDYDSVQHLSDFLKHFNSDFIGLTGTAEEIANVAEQYNIRYSKTSELLVSTSYRKNRIPKQIHDSHQSHMHHGSEKMIHDDDKSHLYSHSTNIYLISPEEFAVRAIFDTTSSVEELVKTTRLLLLENLNY